MAALAIFAEKEETAGDAGVGEELVGQLDDAVDEALFDEGLAGVLFGDKPWGKKETTHNEIGSIPLDGQIHWHLTDAEIKDKFVWMSSNRLDQNQAQAVMDAVWSLETHADMVGFMEMLHSMCND